jgi:hypothetical protein
MSYSSSLFLNDGIVDDIVIDAIDCIWSSVTKQIQSNWLSTLDVPLSAEVALLKMKKLVAWSIQDHDGFIVKDDSLEKHVPDGECINIEIDPWARGI